jgi:hypothetical protein
MTAVAELAATALATTPEAPLRLPPVPWRDPYTVSPEALKGYIELLERACEEQPRSADLRTCLGMAYAMNFEVYKSSDALEAAMTIEPDNFFAKVKYGELHYRLRALIKAERETLAAVELARNSFELGLARKQLQEIRARMREGTQKPEWTKSLTMPAVLLVVVCVVLSIAGVWR